jgi:drug/metabolite transporter (DMT)-like permease
MILLLTIAMTSLLLAGDFFIKSSTQSSHPIKLLFIAAILWVSSIPGWNYLLTQHKLAVIGSLFSIMSVIGSLLIGMFCFHENLGSREWIGCSLAIISIILLSSKL